MKLKNMKLSALLILAITSSVFSQQQTSFSTLLLEQEVRSSASEYSTANLNFSDDLETAKSFISAHSQAENFDFNLINIILANSYFKENDSKQALALYRELKIDDYQKSAKQFEYLNEQFYFLKLSPLTTIQKE